MAPSQTTEDYYRVLGVEQTATPELITTSYRRLALKLHPDRNSRHDATKAFQLLAAAYEVLGDKDKRRTYDLIYPSIIGRRASPQATHTPSKSSTSTSQSGGQSEAAQIAALQQSKQVRSAQWGTRKIIFDRVILELRKSVQELDRSIKSLERVAAAEAAKEAQKNSWTAWLLSPILRQAAESEEEKSRRDRGKQERMVEKHLKERRLEVKKASLEKEEQLLSDAKAAIDAADFRDDEAIQAIQARMWVKEARERAEKERGERERIARFWRQQQEEREKREREAAETLRKKQAEELAEELKRQEEARRQRQQNANNDSSRWREQQTRRTFATGSSRNAHTLGCRHDGWWPKVQGRTTCPECGEIWTYLLECPGCSIKACPKCQRDLRPRHRSQAFRRSPPQARSPSPNNYWGDWYD